MRLGVARNQDIMGTRRATRRQQCTNGTRLARALLIELIELGDLESQCVDEGHIALDTLTLDCAVVQLMGNDC